MKGKVFKCGWKKFEQVVSNISTLPNIRKYNSTSADPTETKYTLTILYGH